MNLLKETLILPAGLCDLVFGCLCCYHSNRWTVKFGLEHVVLLKYCFRINFLVLFLPGRVKDDIMSHSP